MIYLLKRKHDNKLRTTLLGRVARSISYALPISLAQTVAVQKALVGKGSE